MLGSIILIAVYVVLRCVVDAGQYVKDSSGNFVAAPDTPGDWDTGFPRAGTSAMGPLEWQGNYNKVRWCLRHALTSTQHKSSLHYKCFTINSRFAQVTVVVFGGQSRNYTCPRNEQAAVTMAGRTSYRITITTTGSTTSGMHLLLRNPRV